jgi:hypothetical protein
MPGLHNLPTVKQEEGIPGPSHIPSHQDDQTKNKDMMTSRYRNNQTIDVVGSPLRSVLDFLFEIKAIGVANAR